MKKKTLAVAIAAAGSFGAFAETTNETASAELPRIVVEASRADRTALEIPAPVRVITREEIAQSGAKDITDLLERKTSSLNIIRTGAGNPALAQVSMAGWGENGFGRVLVMVDGQRLNFADMSAPLLSQIDLSSVRQVEVLRGSQSVLGRGPARWPGGGAGRGGGGRRHPQRDRAGRLRAPRQGVRAWRQLGDLRRQRLLSRR